MSRQPTDLVDPRVPQLIATCEQGMKKLLQTERGEVFVYASQRAWCLGGGDRQPGRPGSGCWCRAPDISPIPGPCSARPWAARRCARPTSKACRSIRPWSKQAARGHRQHRIVAVFAVHTDTASGASSDLAALRRAIDAAAHPALLVVDIVASLAAAPFAMDALGVNVVMGASQKGPDAAPGDGLRRRRRARAGRRRASPPRYYWDWRRRRSDRRTASSAARRRRPCCSGSRRPLGLISRAKGLASVMRATRCWRARCTRRSRAGATAARCGCFCRVPPRARCR